MTTLAGAIIQAIKDPQGPGGTGPFDGPLAGKVFRDHDPHLDKVDVPYVTVLHPVTDPPLLQGDASVLTRRPEAQVDIWQKRADEDTSLYEAVRALLDGNKLTAYDGHVVRCRVTGGGRVPEPEDGLVHDTILLFIDHTQPEPE